VTQPGYHKGRRAWNKGRKLPPEVLNRQEMDALLSTFSGPSVTARRNRAIVMLICTGVKLKQLVLLNRGDYDPGSGILKVPSTKRFRERHIKLDAQTRASLDAWLDARRELGIGPTAPLFCAFAEGARGKQLRPEYINLMLGRHARRASIDKRVNSNGLRLTGEQEQAAARSRSIEGRIEAYIDDEAFRTRYSAAYEKWLDALHLHDRHPERHATRIGHDCREALAAFAAALVRHHRVRVQPNAGTVDLVRAVLNPTSQPSKKVRAFLDALLSYWGTVHDLANRQVHGASRKAGALVAEDARLLIFQTMLVMYEVDCAVRRGDANFPNRPSKRRG
jgi:hypothetical protein